MLEVLEVRLRGNPEGDPFAHLLVERVVETKIDVKDQSVYEASIRFRYQVLVPAGEPRKGGEFSGAYSKHGGPRGAGGGVSLVSFSMSSGAVFLDPSRLQGNRVGTYFFNEIVLWAQQWPSAAVNQISLLAGQASDVTRKKRRNSFYQRFGIKFQFTDSEEKEGYSLPMLVKDLTPVNSWQQNITKETLIDYIAALLKQQQADKLEISRLDHANKGNIERANALEARGIGFAIRKAWWRIRPFLFTFIFLGGIGALLWFRGLR